jgi:hypothetical protein
MPPRGRVVRRGSRADDPGTKKPAAPRIRFAAYGGSWCVGRRGDDRSGPVTERPLRRTGGVHFVRRGPHSGSGPLRRSMALFEGPKVYISSAAVHSWVNRQASEVENGSRLGATDRGVFLRELASSPRPPEGGTPPRTELPSRGSLAFGQKASATGLRSGSRKLDYFSDGTRASRKPRLLTMVAGAFPVRTAARQFPALWPQPPPRITRYEPL